MPRLPKRLSLSSQATEIIKEMIDQGELHERLPGERTLAERLQIGRDTLRAALETLESEGWISPREHGKRRSILRQSERIERPASTHRIAFLSPKRLENLPPWMLVEFDLTKDLLRRQGYELTIVSPGLFHLQSPQKKLEHLLADHDVDAWILYQCPPHVQAWFQERNIPALLRGHPHEGIRLPAIDEDWHAAAFHAGGILRRKGHHQVGLLMPDTTLAGLQATEEGLAQAIKTGPNPGALRRLIDRREPNSVANALERAFTTGTPPTALVITRSRHILTVISWLASLRRRIPDDLSVIALCHETWYQNLIPTITSYHLPPETTARATSRKIQTILEGRSRSKTPTLLIPDCIQGHSVAPLTQ